MDLELLRSSLSSKIDPIIEHYGTNNLASILVVIYGEDPIILMTEKPKHLKLHAEEISSLSANSEVEKILHIPLKSFLKTMADDPNPTHQRIQEMYTFEYQNKIIWGASARILKQIANRLNL